MSAVLAPLPETYPALAEMGIARFHEISHYSLRQEGNRNDVLKVFYKRAKGSLLPYSRKYRFGRSMKTIVADGGSSRMEDTYEISPYLQQAIVELDGLVIENRFVQDNLRDAKSGYNRKAELLVEINHIDRMMSDKLAPADAKALAARFENVRKYIDAL